MPALPAVPNVLQVNLKWTNDADVDVQNRWFFSYSGAEPGPSGCHAFAGDIVAIVALQNESWGSHVTLAGCSVVDLTSDTAGQGVVTDETIGLNTSGPLTGGTAVCANYEIARRYRGGKPRSYLPWASVDDLVNAQAWAAGSINRWEASLNAIFPAIVGTEESGATISNHVNVSYYQGFTVEGGTGGKRAKNVPTLRATPLVNVIDGITILGRPASQRRRNR